MFLGTPCVLSTCLALRHAIWRKANPAWPVCGIPDVLYVDHGSDFTSQHLDQVAASLRIRIVYPAIGRPQGDELAFVLARHWRRLGLALDDADFTDAQAVASIARITAGNFRLLRRLAVQTGRILKINGLNIIIDDVVEAARSTLVTGAAQEDFLLWMLRI